MLWGNPSVRLSQAGTVHTPCRLVAYVFCVTLVIALDHPDLGQSFTLAHQVLPSPFSRRRLVNYIRGTARGL